MKKPPIKHSVRRSSTPRFRKYLTTGFLTAAVSLTLMIGTLVALLDNADAATSTPSTKTSSSAGTSCTVDPKHKKLQDQAKSDDPSVPWKRNGAKQVTVYFAYGKLPMEYRSYLKTGAKMWSKSPCVEVKIVAKCSDKDNCVPVALKAVKSGDGDFSYSTKGGYMTKGSFTLDSKELKKDTPAERRVVVIHEMGHGLGLDHRKSKKSVMYGSSGGDTTIDAIDYQNLRYIYAKQK